MSLAEIEEIRKVSKAGTSPKVPWVNFWSEMARKTIVKRAYKYWPRADRLDNAVDVLNESEGIYTEPVMPYTPESEIIQSEENAKQELINTIQSLCEDMKQAKNMHALKTHFQAAYKMTVGMQLQQEVQAVYAKCKAKFEEVTQ